MPSGCSGNLGIFRAWAGPAELQVIGLRAWAEELCLGLPRTRGGLRFRQLGKCPGGSSTTLRMNHAFGFSPPPFKGRERKRNGVDARTVNF